VIETDRDALAEAIAAELTRMGFFGWLLTNGNSPLWGERTPEQEIGRVAAHAAESLLAAHEAREARVRALHFASDGDDGTGLWCEECGFGYPCSTIRALDGDA
jgi:hypothetical protein